MNNYWLRKHFSINTAPQTKKKQQKKPMDSVLQHTTAMTELGSPCVNAITQARSLSSSLLQTQPLCFAISIYKVLFWWTSLSYECLSINLIILRGGVKKLNIELTPDILYVGHSYRPIHRPYLTSRFQALKWQILSSVIKVSCS